MIDKVERETLDLSTPTNKSLIVLVHMKRNYNEGHESSLPLFDGWEMKVYYDINVDKQLSLAKDLALFDTNIKAIIKSEKIVTFKTLLERLTEKCLFRLNFEQDDVGNSNVRENLN